jgi:hypothetical protein
MFLCEQKCVGLSFFLRCELGELYVIVEFCLYGNLQKFILANRPHFINQINPDTGHILVQQALYLLVKHINPFIQDTIRTHPFFHQSYFLQLNLFFFSSSTDLISSTKSTQKQVTSCATGTLFDFDAH